MTDARWTWWPELRPCGCYARVSTKDQNWENQRAAMERWCASRGYFPVWYAEHGTGKDTKRAEFSRVIADALAGTVKAVLFWALDRSGRRQLFMLKAIADLDAAGVPVASLQETWLENKADPNRPLFLGIASGLAEVELNRLRERVLAGLGAMIDQATGEKIILQRDPATGRRASTKGKRLGPPTKPLAQLLEAKRLIVSEGLSIRAAALRVSRGLPKRAVSPGGLCAISEGTLRKFLNGSWKGDRAELGPLAPSDHPLASRACGARPEAQRLRRKSEQISAPSDDVKSRT